MNLATCEKYFAPVGRIIVGAFFSLAGVSKFFDLAGTAGYMESFGLPSSTLLVVLVATFETLVGLALIVNKYAKYAALLLATFTLFVSFPFHGPSLWVDSPVQQVMFMKNIALVGALLFMSAHLRAGHCESKDTATTDERV